MTLKKNIQKALSYIPAVLVVGGVIVIYLNTNIWVGLALLTVIMANNLALYAQIHNDLLEEIIKKINYAKRNKSI